MIEVKINDTKISVPETSFLGQGGEAEIYQLPKNNCLKKYYDGHLNKFKRLEKLIALNSRKSEFENKDIYQFVAYPENLAYELENNKYTVCGFSMKLIPHSEPFLTQKYQLYKEKFGLSNFIDDSCQKIIQQLFEMFKFFHSEDIIIGDVQPSNIMIDAKTLKPYLIDFDSIKFSNYETYTNGVVNYVDPIIINQGFDTNNCYVFSKTSDIYALTQICFDFIIGVNPFTLAVFPPPEENELKMAGVNYMMFSDENSNVKGYTIADKELFNKVKNRLTYIQQQYPHLYQQFYHILVQDGRTNLLGQTKNITTNEVEKLIEIKRSLEKAPIIRGYLRSKDRTDPAEFLSFINRFNLELP